MIHLINKISLIAILASAHGEEAIPPIFASHVSEAAITYNTSKTENHPVPAKPMVVVPSTNPKEILRIEPQPETKSQALRRAANSGLSRALPYSPLLALEAPVSFGNMNGNQKNAFGARVGYSHGQGVGKIQYQISPKLAIEGSYGTDHDLQIKVPIRPFIKHLLPPNSYISGGLIYELDKKKEYRSERIGPLKLGRDERIYFGAFSRW